MRKALISMEVVAGLVLGLTLGAATAWAGDDVICGKVDRCQAVGEIPRSHCARASNVDAFFSSIAT